MFKPKSLNEAINLAHMQDEQVNCQRNITWPPPLNRAPLKLPSSTKTIATFPMKHLSQEEMQKKQAQGLCFNCDEKFTA